MQIYRGMDIGTAKVPAGERAVPYHCIDILDPGEPYSAALFQHDARAAIAAIRTRNHLPVLCGGTGLYVRALLDDMEFRPRRRRVRSGGATRGLPTSWVTRASMACSWQRTRKRLPHPSP